MKFKITLKVMGSIDTKIEVPLLASGTKDVFIIEAPDAIVAIQEVLDQLRNMFPLNAYVIVTDIHIDQVT